MTIYVIEYRQKLTTAQKAVERIKSGDTIVHGMSIAEPPALLSAIADRAREDDLKELEIFGDSLSHISEVDAIVVNHVPLLEMII